MHLLRPFLFAVLSAFVAAAPVAPVPWRPKGEDDRTDTRPQPFRGHDQKPESTATGEDQERRSRPVACGTVVRPVAAAEHLEPASGGAPAPADHRTAPRPPQLVRPAAPPPPPSAAPHAADVRAGLIALPPPGTRCT
ncbi:MAG: hypothetical protein ACYTEZ_17310 [Planctomycetota bacterium]